MMVCEALGINQLRSELHQTLFEALRLGNATEGGHSAAFQNLQPRSLPRENVLQVERMMDALDDPRGRIELRNSPTQFRRITITLGNKNRAGSRQVRRRLTQSPPRQQPFVAERLLPVHQNNVLPPAPQFPILEPIIQQQCVAPEFFNGITPTFHPVLIHQHDHVFEIGGQHVRLVPRHLGIQQQGFAIRHHTRRGGVVAKKKLVQQPFMDWRRLRAVAARQYRHIAALVA